MRESEVEEGVVEGGIKEGERQDIQPITRGSGSKTPMGSARQQQDDESGNGKADARKEHLAAGHCGGNVKLGKAKLDERISPSPCYGGSERKHHYPRLSLKDASITCIHTENSSLCARCSMLTIGHKKRVS